MKMGICYCKLGTLSQCVAVNYGEQAACDFFDESSRSSKCMYVDTDLDNHCWSPDAQEFSKKHGVVRFEDVNPKNLLDSVIEKAANKSGERHTCLDCLLYSCADLTIKANEARDNGGLTNQDYWEIGSACPMYIGE